jgi:acyl-phosphate glycerol 3-phosphate acyltransferase
VIEIVVRVVVAVGFAYLMGGIPFGVIVGRRLGVDITALGSGNTGATNVFRSLGWRPALVVALLDVAKGAVPALAARFLLADAAWGVDARDLLTISVGAAAMAGHMFSPYFRFRGGKGVATAAGGILVLMPEAFFVLLVVFVLLILITRIVSVSSILTAFAFPVAIALLYHDRPVLFGFAIVAVALIVWSHRANIGRLLRGEEPRITMGRPTQGSDKEQS